MERYRALGAESVITASTGNHGAAAAWAARRLGMRATVFAPHGASREKLARIESAGERSGSSGRTWTRRRTPPAAKPPPVLSRSSRTEREPAQYDGYGTIAHEILDALGSDVRTIVVPTGNGALIAGIGLVVRKRAPSVRVVAAVAKSAPVMALSFAAGRAVPCAEMETFADGLAVRVAIPAAVNAHGAGRGRGAARLGEGDRPAVGLYARAGIRAEGAAGAGLAAALNEPHLADPIVVVLTGRNVDEDLYRRAIDAPELVFRLRRSCALSSCGHDPDR